MKITDAEKQEFLSSFIESVEFYPEPTAVGKILKKIKFHIPICYNGNTDDKTQILFKINI